MIVKVYLILQLVLFLVQLFFSFKSNMNLKDKRRVIYLRHSLDITFIFGGVLLMKQFPGRYSYLIMVGILFSVLGDVIMSEAIKLKNRLPLGMASFAVTHFFYISAFGSLTESYGKSLCGFLPYTIGSYLIITSAIFIRFVRRPENGILLNNGGFVYGFIVSLMAAFGGAAALTIGGVWSILGPATGLFLLSDAIIALTEIGGHKIPLAGWVIWATYSAAQIGIICVGLL